MSYLIPAAYSGMSTRAAHLRRTPPSSEPGTDYYTPRGTTLRAPTRCRVVGVGGGIGPATGRFVTLDDGTRWIRYLHMLRQDVRVGDDLDPGEAFGLSGASGYGSEHFGATSDFDAAMIRRTGGPHVHVTAFRGRGYTFGSSGTVDFHALTGGAVAGGGSGSGDDDMSVEDIFNARDGEGRNMLDLGRQIRADLSVIRADLVKEINDVAGEVLGKSVPVQGDTRLAGRSSSLGALVAWNDAHVLSTLDAIGKVQTGDVDVSALAAELRASLAPDIVKALGAALSNG